MNRPTQSPRQISRNGRVLWISAMVALAAALPALADDGTLVITADAPCSILIDDSLVFRIEAGQTREAAVTEDTADVTAISVEVPELRWQEDVRVGSDPEEISVSLAEQVEEAREDSDRSSGLSSDDDSCLETRSRTTLVNPETGLEWTRHDNGFNLGWAAAERYCSTLELDTDGGGRWRRPTVEELDELVDAYSASDFRAPSNLQLTGCCVWSSEEHGSFSAWYMDYLDGSRGFVARDFTDGARVLCVR